MSNPKRCGLCGALLPEATEAEKVAIIEEYERVHQMPFKEDDADLVCDACYQAMAKRFGWVQVIQ